MVCSRIRELRPRKDRATDVARRDVFAKSRRTFFKAKDLGDTEENAGIPRRFDHLAAFVRVYAHRFSQSTGLPAATAGEDVLQMTGIGSRDQHGVDFRTAAELFGRRKDMRDLILHGRIVCFLRVARDSAATLQF